MADVPAGPCPDCGADDPKPVLWGYPSPDDFDRFGDTVAWGGCVIPDRPASHECRRCGAQYGLARDEDLA